MKKCPTCHMIVDEKDSCPFCDTSLLYEDPVDGEEKIIFNRYFLIYLAKTLWFSVLCTIVCLVRALIVQPPFSQLLIYMAACCIISVVASVFGRRIQKAITWKYSEDYSWFRIGFLKYFFGGLAVVISFLL